MTTAFLPLLLAGTAMIGLGGWLLWLDYRRAASLAFALLAVSRGFALLALGIAQSLRDPANFVFWISLYAAANVAALCALANFLIVYPRVPDWAPRGINKAIMFLLPLALAVIALIVDPALYRDYSGLPANAESSATYAIWYLSARQGPFGPIATIFELSMGLSAFMFAREFVNGEQGLKRNLNFVMSLGFFAPAICTCLIGAALIRFSPDAPRSVDPSVFNHVDTLGYASWGLALLALLSYLAVSAYRQPAIRRHIVWFFVMIFTSITAGMLVALNFEPIARPRPVYALLGFWSIVGAALIAYAVARYRLFDINLRLKVTLKRSVVAAMFITVYFLASEIGAQLFEDYFGSAYVGIAAAALLLLLLRPLERLSAQFTDNALPNVKPLNSLEERERRVFYREQMELIWTDGQVSAKDRLVLVNLRKRLALDPETAEAIELDVLGTDRPAT